MEKKRIERNRGGNLFFFKQGCGVQTRWLPEVSTGLSGRIHQSLQPPLGTVRLTPWNLQTKLGHSRITVMNESFISRTQGERLRSGLN